MKTITKIYNLLSSTGPSIIMLFLCFFYKYVRIDALIVLSMMTVVGFIINMERIEKKKEKNILDFEKVSTRGRIGSLKHALYRTREQRDKYKELYLSEKERADRHRERLREKRLELFRIKKEEDVP